MVDLNFQEFIRLHPMRVLAADGISLLVHKFKAGSVFLVLFHQIEIEIDVLIIFGRSGFQGILTRGFCVSFLLG